MLCDCHIHIALDAADYRTAAARHGGTGGIDERAIRAALAAYRDAGVTFLRDGGDKWGCNLAARQLAPEYGIEMVVPGPALYFAGSYGGFLGVPFSDYASFCERLAHVRTLGADFVKVILTGIMDFDTYGSITGTPVAPQLVYDIVSAAHDAGMAVMAHVNGAPQILAAVEAEVDSIEHGYFGNAESRAALAASNTIWVPTISPVANLIGTGIAPDETLARICDEQAAAVREVAALGGLIAPGSDAGSHGVSHGEGALQEYRYLEEALGEQSADVLERGAAALRNRWV